MSRKKQTTEEVNVTSEEQLEEVPDTIIAQELDDSEEFVVPDTGEEEEVAEQESE